MGKVNTTSVEGGKDPYRQKGFWLNPEHHFWENDAYSEKGKEVCRDFVRRKRKEVKNRYNQGS